MVSRALHHCKDSDANDGKAWLGRNKRANSKNVKLFASFSITVGVVHINFAYVAMGPQISDVLSMWVKNMSFSDLQATRSFRTDARQRNEHMCTQSSPGSAE